MADLGRAALVVSLGLSLYALVAGFFAARTNRRRLALSARNALFCELRLDARRVARARDGARPPRLLVLVRRRAHEPHAPDRVLAQLVLGWAGGLAAPLAARPDRLRSSRRRAQPEPPARPRRLGRAGARRDRDVLRVHARRRREPVRHADRADRRRRPDAEPAEPVHGRASADALPRLRRPLDPVRVRGRRAALRPDRRALDRRDAPLDADRVDVPRLRPVARRRTGRTSRSAGAATTRGIRSRTPR